MRRRRLAVCVVLVAGAALMAYSLTRPPGDASFLLADARAGGGLDARCSTFRPATSRPDHLADDGRNAR